MTFFRTSLLTAIGLIGLGLGMAGGCAEGASVNTPTGNRGGVGGGAVTDPGGGGSSGIPTDDAGTSSTGSTSSGGTATGLCDPGLKRCGWECVDVTSNPLHCSDCGKQCPAAARVCDGGACICPPETHAVCDDACVDLRSDLGNCGTCGNICAADRVCSAGVCICDPTRGTTPCGTKCVDLMTDLTHCGACNDTGTPACGPTEVCSDGICTSKCKDTETKCGNKCSNLKTDAANCSACGKPCDSTRICTDGACVCQTTRKLCGTVCADQQTDSKNCGACGKTCTPGTECKAGTCVCSANATQCTATGATGVAGARGVAGAGSKTECVDINSHPQHCGACNKPCTAAQSCVDKQCVCTEPNVNCGTPAVCTDLQTSNAHCGGCGQPCSTATQTCQAGACVCKEGLKDCGSAGCVDVTKTAAHCGDCNQPCTGNQLCSSSVCISGDVRVYTKMQSLPASATAESNGVILSVRICNTGTSTVSLKSAKVVYWYSMDGSAGEQVASSPYSSLAGVTVAAVAVEPMRSGNDYSLVATLPATASLPAPTAATNNQSCFEEIQLAVHAGTTWTTGYVVANDWSYLATTTFAVNDKVAMYLGSAKMWGNEPPVK